METLQETKHQSALLFFYSLCQGDHYTRIIYSDEIIIIINKTAARLRKGYDNFGIVIESIKKEVKGLL